MLSISLGSAVRFAADVGRSLGLVDLRRVQDFTKNTTLADAGEAADAGLSGRDSLGGREPRGPTTNSVVRMLGRCMS